MIIHFASTGVFSIIVNLHQGNVNLHQGVHTRFFLIARRSSTPVCRSRKKCSYFLFNKSATGPIFHYNNEGFTNASDSRQFCWVSWRFLKCMHLHGLLFPSSTMITRFLLSPIFIKIVSNDQVFLNLLLYTQTSWNDSSQPKPTSTLNGLTHASSSSPD